MKPLGKSWRYPDDICRNFSRTPQKQGQKTGEKKRRMPCFRIIRINQRMLYPGYVVYVMQVAQSMPIDAYWDDTRFYDRRP